MSRHLNVNKQQDSLLSSTPMQCVKDLVTVLYGGKRFGNHVDEVWPNLFIGDMSVANDRYALWKLGITHVVNATHGGAHSQGSCDFYGSSVDYYGVPAHDSPSFDLSCYFVPSADYIQRALDGDGARVLVHCAVGAINKVKERRWIFPNRGFLKQLQVLEMKLEHRS
ncbi:dual specificity protein phosphatase 13A-like isoform X2 [Nelusetta ayraudi]|uniref:dual specificity protein phosphatase 13A-like isoform X2 n=1 Tax=Nelusetta ayraudi TaxID=303726 RepID=UPI003F711782